MMSRFGESERLSVQRPILSPIPSLADFVALGHHEEDLISFPPDSGKAIKLYRASASCFTVEDIEKLLEAIDSHDYKFCSNLDQQSLRILCGIVTYSEPCGARHRGFYLIAESLHPTTQDDASLREQKYFKKLRLGSVLHYLLKSLARASESEEDRRWMGVLALELLEGCPENVNTLRAAQDEQWLGLTETLKHGKCEILRLLTGSIVRQMLYDGISPEAFWTSKDVQESAANFPVEPQQDTQWISGFEKYVEDMVTQNLLSQERSIPFFAYAATIGSKQYSVEDYSTIFVTVSSRLLQLYIQASPGELATHIDIPLRKIAGDGLIMNTEIQHGESMYRIRIELFSSMEATHFANAIARYDEIVELTFKSKDAASNLMHFIHSETVVDLPAPLMERPQGIDASEYILDDDDDHQMGEPVERVHQAEPVTHADNPTDLMPIDPPATSSILAKMPRTMSKSQPISENSLQKFQHRRRQGLARSQDSEHIIFSAVDSIKVNTVSDTEAVNTKAPNASPQPSQPDPTGVGALKDDLNVGNDVFESPPGDPLRAITKRTGPMFNGVHGQALNGSNRPKLTQQLENDDGELLHSDRSQTGGQTPNGSASLARPVRAKLPTKPNAPALSSKKQPRFAKKNTDGQPKQIQITTKKGEKHDEFDIPPSPPPPTKKYSLAKNAPQPASKKTSKGRNASTSMSKSQAKKKSYGKLTASVEAPIPLVQPKSRRRAAVNANKKIQGFDTANSNSHSREGKNDTHPKRTMPEKNAAVEPFASGEVQHDSIETVGSSDESIAAPAGALQDATESVTETNASNAHRGNTKSATRATKAMIAGEKFDPIAGAARKPKETDFVSSSIAEAENDPLERRNAQKTDLFMPYRQASRPQQRLTVDSVEATHKRYKMVPASNVPPKTAKAQEQTSDHRSTGNRDPFSAKLSAVVLNRERSKGQGALVAQNLQVLNPTAKEPIKRLKRKAHIEPGSVLKKPKVAALEPASPSIPAENTPPLATRKTAIISFSTSGPRNQGTANKRRARKPKSRSPDAERVISTIGLEDVNDALEATEFIAIVDAESGQQQQQQSRQGKMAVIKPDKLQDALAEAEPLPFVDQEQPRIRQQRRVPQQIRIDRLTSKPSSQTTRVDHNGSPMPLRHPTNEPIFIPTNGSLREEDNRSRNQEQCMSNGDEYFPADEGYEQEVVVVEKAEEVLQPTLPSGSNVSHASMPLPGEYEWVNLSKNKKQIPSSPHAPSVTSAFPAHNVYRTGEIVNSRTEETIVPSHPQDPFVGQVAGSSSFTRLLRTASEASTKRRAGAVISDRLKKVRLSTSSVLNDPDKTLVARAKSSRKTKHAKFEEESSSSSSEDASDEELSPTLAENDIEDTPNQWKKALRPHQQNVLSVLTEISHRLLAHMVKSEDTFMDLLADFKKGGNLLIDQLEKEQEAKNIAQAASTAALEKMIFGLYQKTSADLKSKADRIQGSTERVEKEWRARQQSLLASADAALAACAAM